MSWSPFKSESRRRLEFCNARCSTNMLFMRGPLRVQWQWSQLSISKFLLFLHFYCIKFYFVLFEKVLGKNADLFSFVFLQMCKFINFPFPFVPTTKSVARASQETSSSCSSSPAARWWRKLHGVFHTTLCSCNRSTRKVHTSPICMALPDTYPMFATKCIDDVNISMRTIFKTDQKHSVEWKPTCTAMRAEYHSRRIASQIFTVSHWCFISSGITKN